MENDSGKKVITIDHNGLTLEQQGTELNQRVADRIANLEKSPLYQKIFNRDQWNVINKHQTQELSAALSDKEKAAQMIRNGLLISLETKLNAFVATQNVEIDKGLQMVMNKIYADRQDEVQTFVEKFIEQIQRSFAGYEKIPESSKFDDLRKMEQNRISDQMNLFYAMQKKFEEKFMDALETNTRIGRPVTG
jgi:hypothetical protein